MSERRLVCILLAVLVGLDALLSQLDVSWLPEHFGGVADNTGLLLIFLSTHKTGER